MFALACLLGIACTAANTVPPHRHTPRNPLHAHMHHGTGYHPTKQRVQGNIQGHAYHEHGHDPANKRECPCPIEAAVHGSVKKMKAALECGKKAELEPWNEQHTAAGDTPLMIAAMGGHNYLVRMLLEHGADPEIRNKGGTTALMRASARGRYETCRILIDEGGADAEAKDNHGHSVIMHAHIGHHEATERHLRRHIDERRRLKEKEETTAAKSSEL